jgi:stage III sporulation protein AA
MSPEIIAVDEVGSREDIEAIEHVINCGCKLIATVHGSSIDDIKNKPILGRLVREKIFERYIILNNIGTVGNVDQIYDERGTLLFKQDFNGRGECSC